MVRSAAAVLAVLILPSFASAQVSQGTHTVVDDDTLWDLAQRYYQDPWQWRVIWEANRSNVADPNLIFPTQVLVIPGLPGAGAAPVVDAAVAPPAEMPSGGAGEGDEVVVASVRGAPPPGEERTIFFQDTVLAGGVVGGGEIAYVAVSRDQVLSSPWLLRAGESTGETGVVQGFSDPTDRGSTLRSYHRVSVALSTPARVGDQLQTFRVDRTIEGVGQVVIATGIVTVSATSGDGVVGLVTKEYARVQPGDLVRPVPSYTLAPGQRAQAVSGGREAMVMGFAGTAVVPDLGHRAFLDLGASDGITVGDEFVLFSEAVPGDGRGALQVVGVTSESSTVRIVAMDDDVFRQGVVVRLSKKMR